MLFGFCWLTIVDLPLDCHLQLAIITPGLSPVRLHQYLRAFHHAGNYG